MAEGEHGKPCRRIWSVRPRRRQGLRCRHRRLGGWRSRALTRAGVLGRRGG